MTDTIFEPSDIEQGINSPVLGPAYFVARRIADRQMSAFEPEMFKLLLDKFAKEFGERLWEDVRNSLISDVEMNLQYEMWRTVDAIVGALLGGERWALEKYALGPRYEQARIRAAVAAHIPKELQDARIADLEEELAWAKKDVEFYR